MASCYHYSIYQGILQHSFSMITCRCLCIVKNKEEGMMRIKMWCWNGKTDLFLSVLHFCKTQVFVVRHCLQVRYRTPRLRGYGSGTGPRATPMRTVSGSGSLWNNYSTSLGIRGCVSVPARICSNIILPTKTRVEVSLCFVRHLWSSVFTVTLFK